MLGVSSQLRRYGQASHLPMTKDNEIERAYQRLCSGVKDARQFTAQAIAHEKLIEQQLQKEKDHAETWQNRADIAAKQNNAELVAQALAHGSRYSQAAIALEQELESIHEKTLALRRSLAELEGYVLRLNLARILLAVLTNIDEDQSKSYEGIATAFGDYIRKTWRGKESSVKPLTTPPTSLEQRLDTLEEGIKRGYRSMQSSPVAGANSAVSIDHLHASVKDLQNLKKTALEEISVWKEREERAREGDNNQLITYAGQRRQQHEMMLSKIDSATELLSNTADALQKS